MNTSVNIFKIINSLILVGMVLFGWVMNIINLFSGTYETVTATVFSIVGIFMAPLGALVYFIAG